MARAPGNGASAVGNSSVCCAPAVRVCSRVLPARAVSSPTFSLGRTALKILKLFRHWSGNGCRIECMSDSEVDVAADRVAAAFTLAVDGLLDVALTSLPGLALIELLGRVETQLRRMTSFDHALVTALVDSDACVDVGARNTAAVLVQALRVSPSEAAARVRAAKDLGPRTDFTGGPIEPTFATSRRRRPTGPSPPPTPGSSPARCGTCRPRCGPNTVCRWNNSWSTRSKATRRTTWPRRRNTHSPCWTPTAP